MKYEIVNLRERIILGLSAKTANDDPEMGKVIGGLWTDFYGKNIYGTIKKPVNAYSIGLYSDYTDKGYTVTVGREVSTNDNSGMDYKIIPAGRYAKFEIQGHMQKAVAEAWQKIWNMDLERTFTGDFEEYLDSDMENGHINIYIAIK